MRMSALEVEQTVRSWLQILVQGTLFRRGALID